MARGSCQIGGRPAFGVGGEAAGPDLEQQPDRSRVAVLRGQHQRGAAVLHAGVDGGTEIRQRVDDIRPPDERGEQQRGIEVIAIRGCEFLDRAGAAFPHGQHQRLETLRVLQFRIRSLFEEPPRHLRLVRQHRRHQRGPTGRPAKVDFHPAIQQIVRRGLRAGGCRSVKRGIPRRVPAIGGKFRRHEFFQRHHITATTGAEPIVRGQLVAGFLKVLPHGLITPLAAGEQRHRKQTGNPFHDPGVTSDFLSVQLRKSGKPHRGS